MFGLILFVLAVIIYYYGLRERKNKQIFKPFYSTPTVFPFPIIGSTYRLLGKNVLEAVDWGLRNYGPSVLAYIPHRTYITMVPEEMKIILNHPAALEKSAEYNHLQSIFHNTLLLAPVESWRKHRKLISKSFKQTILDMFVITFYEKSCILNKILLEGSYDKDNIYTLFEKYTLDVFSDATLGIKSTSLENKDDNYFVQALSEAQKLAVERVGNLIKMNDFLFSFLPDAKALNNCVAGLNNYIAEIMKKKRESKLTEVESDRLPVLDLLLNSAEKEKLLDTYIQQEMILFAAAATDTTAYTTAYTLCLLGMHPEIQERVYQEIIDVVGKDGDILHTDLPKLKYTKMAIYESQRLLPSIPLIARKIKEKLDLGDKVIPPNTGVILSFFHMHRDPNIYPDPMVYNPDRFLPEEIAKRPQYSFLPFSGGPRNCIGMKYASMLLKTTIANIVRNFRITTKHKSVSDLKLISSIVMTTAHPLDVTLHPR
ncbi:cytochrome P450 4C1-like [Aethina tumida]|uniref:cytochrome P450 4C1-like n=1 Tax=Aethina tumida TaxID=116153 RepID=UPI0021492648|nr:cytochrome P450 4C1-like [Aethina tumida]